MSNLVVTLENFRPLKTVKSCGRSYSTAEITRVETAPGGLFKKPQVWRHTITLARLVGSPVWFDTITMQALDPHENGEVWRLHHDRFTVRAADDLAAASIRKPTEE